MFSETESSYAQKLAVLSLLNKDYKFQPCVYRMLCLPVVNTGVKLLAKGDRRGGKVERERAKERDHLVVILFANKHNV